MIAINWFEILLPSSTFKIPVVHIKNGEPVPPREKSINYRTVKREFKGETQIYHITTSPPDSLELTELVGNTDPSIVKYLIEHGFASRLQTTGFSVKLRHVGGVGFLNVGSSSRPQIYSSMEGIKFRCFYFIDREEPIRWGLIISFVIRHYFNISLNDVNLIKLAGGNRVVRVDSNGDDMHDIGNAHKGSLEFKGDLEFSTRILYKMIKRELLILMGITIAFY
jgi:hypothetical protein